MMTDAAFFMMKAASSAEPLLDGAGLLGATRAALVSPPTARKHDIWFSQRKSATADSRSEEARRARDTNSTKSQTYVSPMAACLLHAWPVAGLGGTPRVRRAQRGQ
jgi:hypothetical protein